MLDSRIFLPMASCLEEEKILRIYFKDEFIILYPCTREYRMIYIVNYHGRYFLAWLWLPFLFNKSPFVGIQVHFSRGDIFKTYSFFCVYAVRDSIN